MKFFHRYMSVSLAGMIALAGCTKSLNYTPEVFVAQPQVFKDQAGATAAVTGIYTQLQTLKKSDYALIGIVGTDEARCTYQSQGYGDYWANVTGLDVYDIKFSSQNYQLTGFWQDCYIGIANANAAILGIPDATIADPSVRSRLLGECKFMRALFYFYLVQLYGDIPLRTEATPFSAGVKRSPAADVYALIIDDLKFAIANLWTKSKNPDIGRASVEAAKALLGKVYLTQKDYNDAKTTFEDLINTNGLTLLTDYSQLFDGQHENNAESLFEIQYSTDANNTQGLQNLFGSYAGPGIPGEAYDSHTPGNGGTVVMATAYYSDTVFDKTNDKRYLVSIWPHRYDGSGNTMDWWVDPGLPTIKKYDISSSDIDIYNSGKNLYYLRASDVYLMYAEVLNELGQTGPALVPLNKVRNRAGLQNLEDAWGGTPTQTELRTELLDERMRELGGEGWRWFDLKRTGTLVSRVMTHNNPRAYYVTINGSGDPHPAQNVSDKNNLYPIPLNELQTNSALSLTDQNPGY
ncbi:MAG TPA: RagB/SusD family nutrient uptake outer membrane protein [Puia sp.]|nr:RagB/SusD family nutrient uptake outer membrane protein [Puia sp.]